jgi:hypothetical protein
MAAQTESGFDPIPILKTDSPRTKAIKKRLNKQRLAAYHAKYSKGKNG